MTEVVPPTTELLAMRDLLNGDPEAAETWLKTMTATELARFYEQALQFATLIRRVRVKTDPDLAPHGEWRGRPV